MLNRITNWKYAVENTYKAKAAFQKKESYKTLFENLHFCTYLDYFYS